MDRNIYQVQKPLPPAVAVNPNQATVQQPPNAFSLSRCPRIRGRSWYLHILLFTLCSRHSLFPFGLIVCMCYVTKGVDFN